MPIPIEATEKGDLHFDLDGERLHGHFALVRRGERGGKEQWLLLHKKDEHAVVGWDAEDYPASVKSGRTNDEVTGCTRGHMVRFRQRGLHQAARNPRRSTRSGAKGSWALRRSSTAVDQPRQGAVPRRRLGPGDHQARSHPSLRPDGAGDPAVPRRSSGQSAPLPRWHHEAGFWQKALPRHAPEWLTRWHYEDARPGETQEYLVIDSPAALAWAANNGAVELHPWTSTTEHPQQPTWAMIDIDPGESSDFDDVLVLARLHRTALDHLGVKAMPKVTGQRGIQIWVPVATGYTFDDTRTWVERLSRLVGDAVPDMVSWEWESGEARRPHPAGLHAERGQQDVGCAIQRPAGRRRTGVGPDLVGRVGRPGSTSGRWTIRNIHGRLDSVGDPLVPLIGLQQRLPTL